MSDRSNMYLPASAFRANEIEADMLKQAARRGRIRRLSPRSDDNPSGVNRYHVADVQAAWPELFCKVVTSRDKMENTVDSGEMFLTGSDSCGKFNIMSTPTAFTTLNKAARQLGVPGPYLRQQVEAGFVPALRIGRGLRIDPRAARVALAMIAAGNRATPEEQR